MNLRQSHRVDAKDCFYDQPVKKELREVALISGLGAGLLLASIAIILWRSTPSNPQTLQWLSCGPAVYSSYLTWMQIGAPLLALALGLLQIIPESARDHWAFLIHRPVTVSQIWCAKVIAGLGCYLFATLSALLIVTAWLCVKGHFPGPFEPVMALPCLGSILAGSAFYFAGQLVSLRKARWYGSKFLPILTAALCVLLNVASVNFAESVAFSSVFLIVLSIAANGSFKTQGEYSGQSILNRVMLGAVMGTGSVISLVIVFAILASVWSAAHGGNVRGGWKTATNEEIRLSDSGQLLLTDNLLGEHDDTRPVKVMDLSGKVIPDASKSVNDYTKANALHYQDPSTSYESYDHYYQFLYTVTVGAVALYGRLDHVLCIYSSTDNGFIGYLGSDGFLHNDLALSSKFPDGENCIFTFYDNIIVFPTAIYNVDDLSQLKQIYSTTSGPLSQKIMSPPPGEQFLAATITKDKYYDITPDSLIAVATKKRFILSTRDGQEVANYLLPNGFATAQSAQYSLINRPDLGKTYVINSGDDVNFDGVTDPPPFAGTKVVENGAVDFVITPPSKPFITHYQFRSAWPALFAPAFPTGLAIVGTIFVSAMQNPGQVQGFTDSGTIQYAVDILEWALIGGVACALAYIPLARRYGASGKHLLSWLLCGLFLNWLGILMILAIRPFPMLVECWNCGRRRAAQNDNCEYCGKAHSSSLYDGREIVDASNSALTDLMHAG